ncbi:fam-c protein [Plasmodium vinckei lentum]|uniref:Fam-c protein n=1 Tax=Plasmodium vinckei lentum TaxID=138297 RepID=A0A6V7SM57_PLAVN|nr:fam-c protein [Plasmodium vinckei lentum]
MNKRIFSLVCVLFYVFMAVSIYCSEQKASDARNKSVHGTKEINRSNDEDDNEPSCFNIYKRDKKSKISKESIRTKENLYSKVPSNLPFNEMIKEFINNNKDLPTDRSEFEKYILNILKNDPEQSELLNKLFLELLKQYSHLKTSDQAMLNNYLKMNLN